MYTAGIRRQLELLSCRTNERDIDRRTNTICCSNNDRIKRLSLGGGSLHEVRPGGPVRRRQGGGVARRSAMVAAQHQPLLPPTLRATRSDGINRMRCVSS